MADDRILVDCEKFLEGNCVDPHCAYRHCSNLFQPRVVCKYWVQFLCIDVKCRFLHPSEEALVLLQQKDKKLHTTTATATITKPTPLCKFFGRCKKLGCPFLHDLPEASVSRHPSIDSSSKAAVVVDDGLSRSNSSSSNDSGITTTSSPLAGKDDNSLTVGIKRDRGVEILQRYSVTAIAEETTTKKTKISIHLTTTAVSVQEDVTKNDFIAL